MALLEEVARRLSTQGVGTTSSTSAWRVVYRDFLPGSIGGSTKAQQIVITPTGGFPQLLAESLTYPTFQIRVRGASSGSTGLEQKVTDVITALNKVGPITLLSVTWRDCVMEGEPLFIGRDEEQRPVYALNFTAWRSRTT